MAGETTVGSIVGFLRLDASQWNRTLAEAGAAAEALGSSDPNVDVHANTSGALASLASVESAAAAVDHSDPTIDVHANTAGAEAHLASAQKSTLGLLDAVLLLGPALVPVAGAAAGLGVAFGGLGAAGVLAFLGIKNAMKNGSAAGVVFQRDIDTLKGNLDLLAATAAGGILDGFTGSVRDLQGKMPQIQNGIGVLSTELGHVMRPAADGIATAFIKLLPLMTDAADYAIKGARAFDQWAHGDGLQKFGGYAQAVLPGVLQDIGQLVELAGKVVGAFAGWGGGVLSLLGTFASLLNSLPTGVLSVIASGGLAVYSAFKTFGTLQGLVSGLGGALGTLASSMQRMQASSAGAALQRVASGMRAVGTAGSVANLAVGGIAAALGVALFAWSLYKQKQQEAKAAQEAMTQAIQEDSGALGENAQKVLAKSIADEDLLGKAKQLGASQADLTNAIAKGGSAFTDLSTKVAKNNQVTTAAAGAAGGMGKEVRHTSNDAQDFLGKVKALNGQIAKGKKEYDANALAAKALGNNLGETKKQLTSVQLANMDVAAATKEQKQAIDQLNQSLDAEISKQLQLQGGLTGEAAARKTLLDTLKKSKATTDLNTDAGIRNRQNIEQAVGQIQSYRDQQIKNHVTTAQATADYEDQGNALLRSIAKIDGANSATYKYAQQLLKVPKDVKSRVGIEGNEVAASQLAGLGKSAKALGNTKVQIPTSTPNAHNTAQVLNTIQKSVLAANGKSVKIPTEAINSPETLRNLEGIKGARLNADGSVSIPTSALNATNTIGLLDHLGRVATDADGKSVVIPSSAPNAKGVAGLINNIHGAQIRANGKHVTITSSAPLAESTRAKIDKIRGAQVSANGKSVVINSSVPNYGSVLGQIRGILAAAQSKSFTVTANYVTNRIEHVQRQLSRYPSVNAKGSITNHGVQMMAAGGVTRDAMLSDRPITWGEAGLELYAPLAKDSRAGRAIDLIGYGADYYGYDMVKRGSGAAPTFSTGGYTPQTKQLLSAPSVSAADLEKAVSRGMNGARMVLEIDGKRTIANVVINEIESRVSGGVSGGVS